ncbi:MAG: 5'-deoxynucleotidase [Planctomycetaceae bacterium]|nr:5'-deoxynucleotidase [Planctomycetaceae bacterium]
MSDNRSESSFFAYLSRMRLIRRWSLMHNTSPENIQEHSHRVAMLAHALAVIGNRIYGKSYNPERAAFLALYHDASEIITGDMPTPVKYYDDNIRAAYKGIEEAANRRLLSFLPEELRDDFAPAFSPAEADADSWRLVKAADKLCAWLKCVEERRSGNREFLLAEEGIKAQLDSMDSPEVRYFLDTFAPGFLLTLDELGAPLAE